MSVNAHWHRGQTVAEHPADFIAGELITLNDNGAWSSFMDELAIVADGKLIVGSVRAIKDFDAGRDDPNWGNVEVAVYDVGRGTAQHVVLDKHFEQDDHDSPALLAPSGWPHSRGLHAPRVRAQGFLSHLRAESSAGLGAHPGDCDARRR